MSDVLSPEQRYFPYINRSRPSIMDIMFKWPGTYRHMLAFTNKIMRGPSELSREQRELIAAYVSVLNQCSFCIDSHTYIAEAFGIDAELLRTLVDDPQSAVVEERMRPVLTLVRKVTLNSAQIVKADIERVLQAGWDYKTAHDAIAVASLFNFHNRLVSAHGIPGIPPHNRKLMTWFLVRLNYCPPGMNLMFRLWGWFKNPKKLGGAIA